MALGNALVRIANPAGNRRIIACRCPAGSSPILCIAAMAVFL